MLEVGTRVIALENVYKPGSLGMGLDKPVSPGTRGVVVRVWSVGISCPYDVQWENGNKSPYPMYAEEIREEEA